MCDNDSVISISQLVHNHDIITSEPYTSDEYNVFIPITSAQDELKPRFVAGCKVFEMESFHIWSTKYRLIININYRTRL